MGALIARIYSMIVKTLVRIMEITANVKIKWKYKKIYSHESRTEGSLRAAEYIISPANGLSMYSEAVMKKTLIVLNSIRFVWKKFSARPLYQTLVKFFKKSLELMASLNVWWFTNIFDCPISIFMKCSKN